MNQMDNIALLKHSVLPSNAKPQDSYEEFDSVDFNLDFNGRKMLANTVKISGRLSVTKNGADFTTLELVGFDETIGIHSFIDTVTTSTQLQGMLETLQEPARYVGMLADQNQTRMTLGGNLSNTVELKTFDSSIPPRMLLTRETNQAFGEANCGQIDKDLSFVFSPLCCLNSAVGVQNPSDVSISYNTTGTVHVSIRLARLSSALFGLNMDNTIDYALTDLKCHFISIAEDNVKNDVVLELKSHVRQTIQSANTNVSVRVPMVCNSFSASFLPAFMESDFEFNAYERSAINDMKRVEFLFNNSILELITYDLSEREEILRHYSSSLGTGRLNNLNPSFTNAGKNYGIGLNFDATDLTRNSFNLQLEAPSFGEQPFIIYCYFKGLMQL